MNYNLPEYLLNHGWFSVKGLYKNGNLWWLRVRVPVAISDFYPDTYLKTSLKTADKAHAIRKAMPLLESWLNDFKSKQAQVQLGQDLRMAQGVPSLIEDALNDRLQVNALALAKSSGLVGIELLHEAQRINDSSDITSVVTPTERSYLVSERVISSSYYNLTDALNLYLKVHPTGSKPSIIEASNYAINSLIKVVGDTPLINLTRNDIRSWIDESTKKNKTASVQRQLNQLKAIFRSVEAELSLDLRSLYNKISVPEVGSDSNERFTPSIEDLKMVLKVFSEDPVITFLVYFGGRISEVSGLMKTDIHLDAPIPYIEIKANSIRSLKTASSAREFPLVDGALVAITCLYALANKDPSLGLLPRYFKEVGGDNLSANLNKKLKRINPKLTTHCFRHGMKDLLLRVADVPEYLCDEIQGHSSSSISRGYGAGAALRKKAEALSKAYAKL
jgi:integrase